MQPAHTYRKFTSAVFLLLYLFIATPVQLWHNHKIGIEKSSVTKIAKVSAGNQSEDCKICQHTYAVYIVDDVRCDVKVIDFLSNNNSFFNTSFPSPCIEQASNKGPPQI